MREILFRGKRVDNYVKDSSIDYTENGVGEWVYGDIIHRRYYKNRDVVVIRTEDSGFDNYSDYEVEPSSVGQYTGLTDKNGNKIFVGDIIKSEQDGMIGVIRFGEYQTTNSGNGECHLGFSVEWYGKYSDIIRRDLGWWVKADNKDINIVGNIHDNPELLEVE